MNKRMLSGVEYLENDPDFGGGLTESLSTIRHRQSLVRSLSVLDHAQRERTAKLMERDRLQSRADHTREQIRQQHDDDYARRGRAHHIKAIRMNRRRIKSDADFRKFAMKDTASSLSRSSTVGELNLAGHTSQTDTLRQRQDQIDNEIAAIVDKTSERDEANLERRKGLEKVRARLREEKERQEEAAKQVIVKHT